MEIVNLTSKVTELFKSIVNASNEQSSSMSEIVNSLNSIEQVICDNSQSALQMSTSAGTLLRQAEELRYMVSHFRLGDDDKRTSPISVIWR